VCLALALGAWAATPSAARLYRDGRKAERAGDVVRAYLLYSQAAALDSHHPEYWARAQALRTRAALKAKPLPPSLGTLEPSPATATPAAEELPPGFSTSVSDQELAELGRLKPPPELSPVPGRRTLDLRGDARALFEQAARAFGLGIVFDTDYEAGRAVHLRLEDVDCRAALHALAAATGSVVFPAGQRLILVVKDTPQKRTEREPTIAVTIPVPETVTPQEAQEVGRAVQQTMEIQRLVVDADRRIVLIKDRMSKVRPAQALFEQLAHGRTQVAVEMDFLEVDRSNVLSYGLLGPGQFPIFYLGRGDISGSLQTLASFFGGHVILGLGIANAQLFATMNDSSSKTLLRAIVRSGDGQPATLHVGDKYPVLSAGFLGSGVGLAPSFNFEDLGLVLKVTPHVHDAEEMSLEVEAEFKVLSGQSLNGVPIIASRKLTSKVRLRNGEWAVIAGMFSATEAREITGLPGLVRLPFLRKNDRTRTSSEVLLLIKPTLESLAPTQYPTRPLWIGSEARLKVPL